MAMPVLKMRKLRLKAVPKLPTIMQYVTPKTLLLTYHSIVLSKRFHSILLNELSSRLAVDRHHLCARQ